ncbi:GDSL esterase/lipase [Salvia divinorum]|uniref:GDSL esterase/lipase n=1 Tax=Salvia divinorum TaxID=28513 RepID=A0ABD1IKA9_SALDI
MVQYIKEKNCRIVPQNACCAHNYTRIDLDGRQEYARLMYGDKDSKVPDSTNEVAGTYGEQCLDAAKDARNQWLTEKILE